MSNRGANQNNPAYANLLAGLQQVERRLRLHEAAGLAPWAVAGALAVGVALALIDRFQPLLPWPQMLLLDGGLLLLALLAIALYAWLRPRRRLEIARRGDDVLALDERLSTAVEDRERPHPGHRNQEDAASYAWLSANQLNDAVARLSGTLPELPKRLSLAPPRRSLALPLLLALVLALAFWAPNPADAFFAQQTAVQNQEKAEAQKIEELQKELATLPTDATTQQLQAELQALEDALKAGNLSQEEAMAQLSESESKLQKLVDNQAPGERAALDSLGQQLSEQPGSLGEAGQALQQGDTSKAAQALDKAAQEAQNMTPEQRQTLADTLRKSAADLANNDPALAQQLNDAAQALESGDPNAAQQALENLADTVQQTGQNLASQQQLEKTLSQIQDSKQNIASAGAPSTPVAGGTPLAGTPMAAGTSLSGTPIALQGTPFNGTVVTGTQVALNLTPLNGTPARTGTPVIVPGQNGQGTPVVAPGNQPGQSSGQTGQPGQTGAPSNSDTAGSGHQEPVAVPPTTLNAQGTPVGVTARPNNGDTGVTGVNTDPAGGSASVPYSDVYSTYNQTAQQTLEGDYIPAGMKDLVRRYFTAIDPKR